MKKNIIKMLLAGLIISVANIANAGLITTHGFLTTDDSTNYVTDTQTGRQYTRFDAFDFSYAETLEAISIGGAFEGWLLATSTVADDWAAAALGVSDTPCSYNTTNRVVCGQLGVHTDGDFGDSYGTTIDYFAYVNTVDLLYKVGLYEIRSDGTIRDTPQWSPDPAVTDSYTKVYVGPINYLLYRDVNVSMSVPEPTTLTIFALAMAGLATRRFKKQS